MRQGARGIRLPGPGEALVRVAAREADRLDTGLLPPGERERAAAIAHPRVRARFVGGRLLLRSVLAGMLGGEPQRFAIAPDAFGAPRLTGVQPDLFVSISHGALHDVVAVALVPVGVDIEEDAPPDIDAVATTILSDEERSAFLQLAADQRQAAFLAAWTRKEAVLKAAGRGFLVDPRGIETSWGHQPTVVRSSGLAGAFSVVGMSGTIAVALAGTTVQASLIQL